MRLRGALGAAVVVAAATVTAAPAAERTPGCVVEWPTFQHDLDRTASATCASLSPSTVPTLVPHWFASTNGPVTTEPAVSRGTVYVGDYSGVFHAIRLVNGGQQWTFDVKHNPVHVDRHATSYGEFTSSPAVSGVPHLGRTVFFAGGATLYAVDATTGTPRWARDLDPANPTSSAEIESSPVVWAQPHRAVVFVGLDSNEDRHVMDGGVVALDATSGRMLWKYDADRNRVVHNLRVGGHSSTGCGDVWSSPALDPKRRVLYFGGGNCQLDHNGHDTQRLFAVSADTGRLRWRFHEPAANHGIDDDFGSSPILARVHGLDIVVQAGKSGWVYEVARSTGALVRQIHVSEGSSIGGFIGSGAVASASNGDPVFFGDTAIPVSEHGVVDQTALADPTRMASLHAVDLVTGKSVWAAPAAQTPSYAPVTVANGVVFAPDTTAFAMHAYDAATGAPLWRLPTAAAMSGGVTVVGDAIVFGAGTFYAQGLPPQATGIWSFHLPRVG